MNLKREPNLNRGLVSGSHVSFSEFDYNFFLSYTSGGQIKNIHKPKAILSLLIVFTVRC